MRFMRRTAGCDAPAVSEPLLQPGHDRVRSVAVRDRPPASGWRHRQAAQDCRAATCRSAAEAATP